MKKKLTELQQELITYLPKGFEGTKLEKLTMAAFCYCNQSAIDSGNQTFTLPYTKLSELTGYGRTMLSKAVHKLCMDNGITRLKTGNYITHTSTEYAVFNVGKVNIGIEHINSVYQMKLENIEKEKNNNNTLNSTTDMLYFNERLALLSNEIEALKAENESLRIDIKSLKDDNKTLNECVNNASKIINELKDSVNLNYYEIWNLKKEFSDQFNIAKNPNVAMSERLKAAKIMNSIAYRYPDILTKKQRKAAMALLYINDNTNVESKPEPNAEVIGMQDHSLTKESEYTFKECQENYKGLIKNLQQKNPKYIGKNYNHVKAEVRKEKVLEIYNPLISIKENLQNIASNGFNISKGTLMRYVNGNGSRKAKTSQIEALIDTTVSIRENERRLRELGLNVCRRKITKIYNKIKNI